MIGAFWYWGLLVLKFLQRYVLDPVLDLATGYTTRGGSRRERTLAWMHHEHSAQIVRVVAHAQFVDVLITSGKNFLWLHEKYVNPRYILEHKNVTLYMMDTENAYFCVSDEDVDVYDTTRFPFCFLAQKEQSKRLIVLPLASFNRLGDELGDPTVPVCLVNMTARCGSTLISQMMKRVPGTRSISEPWILHQVNNHFRKRWFNWDQSRKLIQTCIRLQCKVEPDSGVTRLVLKLAPPASPMFVEINKLFPKIDLIFNTRHPKPSIISMHKITQSQENSIYVTCKLFLKEIVYNFFSVPYTEEWNKLVENPLRLLASVWRLEDITTYSWASVFITWRENKEIYKHVCLYENLTKHSEREAAALFRAIGVDEKFVPQALEALKTDSQKGTFGKREEKPVVADDAWPKIDGVLKELTGLSVHMTVDEFKAACNCPGA